MLNNQLTQQQPQSELPLLTLRICSGILRFTLANQNLVSHYLFSIALHARKVDIAISKNRRKASSSVSLPPDFTIFSILFLMAVLIKY